MNNKMERKNCLLLNFTVDGYHWGCYGTSIELYDSLIERGYYVNYHTVNEAHSKLAEVPTELKDFDSAEQAKRFTTANLSLFSDMVAADVVVCNGEGTLHRNNLAPWNLLYLMYFSKKHLEKRVHLINHSSYPSGSLEVSEHVDVLYGGVLRTLDLVASREINSTANLKRLSIDVVQSFDCLPRFIDRYAVARTVSPDGPILVSGGMALNEQQCKGIAEGVAPLVSKQRPAIFITGAKTNPAVEDKKQYELMCSILPALQFSEAATVGEWLEIIGAGSVLVSGRFHHTIAAASLLTPVVCLPSNTMKIEGICSMLGLNAPIPGGLESRSNIITRGITQALDGESPTISSDTLTEILALGERNFDDL